jgi:hypothetical protein
MNPITDGTANQTVNACSRMNRAGANRALSGIAYNQAPPPGHEQVDIEGQFGSKGCEQRSSAP